MSRQKCIARVRKRERSLPNAYMRGARHRLDQPCLVISQLCMHLPTCAVAANHGAFIRREREQAQFATLALHRRRDGHNSYVLVPGRALGPGSIAGYQLWSLGDLYGVHRQKGSKCRVTTTCSLRGNGEASVLRGHPILPRTPSARRQYTSLPPPDLTCVKPTPFYVHIPMHIHIRNSTQLPPPVTP